MIKIIYFILIITTFVVLSSLLITLVIYRKQFAKRIENTKEDIQIKGINKRKMHFLSGKNRLTGYIYENKEKNCSINKIILFVHGYGVSHKNYTKEICELVNRGHCVFAYDMTCGDCVPLGQTKT